MNKERKRTRTEFAPRRVESAVSKEDLQRYLEAREQALKEEAQENSKEKDR